MTHIQGMKGNSYLEVNNYEPKDEFEEAFRGYYLTRSIHVAEATGFHGDDTTVILWRLSRSKEAGGVPEASESIINLIDHLDDYVSTKPFGCDCEHDCCGHQFSDGARVDIKNETLAYVCMGINQNF